MKKLTVKLPAIRTKDGEIHKAKSINMSHEEIGVKGKRGFVLSDGTFVDRKEAAKIAENIGEVPKSAGKKLHTHELRNALGLKKKVMK